MMTVCRAVSSQVRITTDTGLIRTATAAAIPIRITTDTNPIRTQTVPTIATAATTTGTGQAQLMTGIAVILIGTVQAIGIRRMTATVVPTPTVMVVHRITQTATIAGMHTMTGRTETTRT